MTVSAKSVKMLQSYSNFFKGTAVFNVHVFFVVCVCVHVMFVYISVLVGKLTDWDWED